jgi:hypothetical protein
MSEDDVVVAEYSRVIPRDLFNEAKLLKCLGQLSLLAHDGRDASGSRIPAGLSVHFLSEGDEPFHILQREADGGLVCSNIRVLAGGTEFQFYSIYNSRSPYPLVCVDGRGEEIEVFRDDGSLTSEFMLLIAGG